MLFMNRRTFIQSTAAGAAATLFSPYGIAAPRASKYRAAVYGTGWWGMNILRVAIAAGRVESSGHVRCGRKSNK